jgi:NADPH-dependent 2,4-dienoyl-CoA reductase/sulfur reductase-like enzyme
MPHALTELNLAEVTKPAAEPAHEIRADVCVVGAGIAGLSAAIESARLHRDVVLVDSLPLIGGQMVHSLIGLFCGVFGNGPEYRQLTHGIFDDSSGLTPEQLEHARAGYRNGYGKARRVALTAQRRDLKATAHRAFTANAIRLDRRRDAFEFQRTKILTVEQSFDEPIGSAADYHRVRLCCTLETGS